MNDNYALGDINEKIDSLKGILFPPMKALKIAIMHAKSEGYT